MNQIWKEPIAALPMDSYVALPCGAQVLTAQMQGELIALWAQVDPDAELVRWPVRVVFTGQDFVPEEGAVYVATVVQRGLVMHVFVGAEEPMP